MHAGRELQFFTDLAALKDTDRFRAHLAPLRKTEWVVYAKPPFAGPKQVLAYLVRYTHRVAIANSRLLDLDETHVSFRWKDYRESGLHKSKVMRINVGEFMRRFLLHVLPDGFHRIRHYGLFANGHRADKLALCRSLLHLPATPTDRYNDDDNGPTASFVARGSVQRRFLQRPQSQSFTLTTTTTASQKPHHSANDGVPRGVSPNGSIQKIQVYLKDLRALPVHPEPALSWHRGFRRGAHARHKTTPVSHASRRHCGRVAARGACAATRTNATDRRAPKSL
jgi:Putative transposase